MNPIDALVRYFAPGAARSNAAARAVLGQRRSGSPIAPAKVSLRRQVIQHPGCPTSAKAIRAQVRYLERNPRLSTWSH